MKPFYVLSRKNQLEVLKNIRSNSNQFGLLVNTSHISNKLRASILSCDIEVICDSGIFEKKRKTYTELFNEYHNTGAQYGIIIDYYKDTEKTIDSAIEALKQYDCNKYCFKLVAVAQGNTIEEYIECYEELRAIGYKHIAIGGLLESIGHTRKINDEILEGVLEYLEEFCLGHWVFILGANSKTRVERLRNSMVYGADSNNWVFKYNRDGDRKKEIGEYVEKINNSHSFIHRAKYVYDLSLEDGFIDNEIDEEIQKELDCFLDIGLEIEEQERREIKEQEEKNLMEFNKHRYQKQRIAQKDAHRMFRNKEFNTFRECLIKSWDNIKKHDNYYKLGILENRLMDYKPEADGEFYNIRLQKNYTTKIMESIELLQGREEYKNYLKNKERDLFICQYFSKARVKKPLKKYNYNLYRVSLSDFLKLYKVLFYSRENINRLWDSYEELIERWILEDAA